MCKYLKMIQDWLKKHAAAMLRSVRTNQLKPPLSIYLCIAMVTSVVYYDVLACKRLLAKPTLHFC